MFDFNRTKKFLKCFKVQNTFRNGIGNPMSTLPYSLLFVDTLMFVRSFNVFLRIFIPSFVSVSHVSVRSFSSFSPVVCSMIIVTFSEFLILQIVLVDSRLSPSKIFLPKILLIKVDFPALVSPVTDFK